MRGGGVEPALIHHHWKNNIYVGHNVEGGGADDVDINKGLKRVRGTGAHHVIQLKQHAEYRRKALTVLDNRSAVTIQVAVLHLDVAQHVGW